MIEYAVEVRNKYHNSFIEQIDVFSTYEEAEKYIKNADIDIDEESEYFEIIEIEYDEYGNEIGIRKEF